MNIMTKKNKKRNRILLTLLVATLSLGIVCCIYVSDYYHADAEAIEAFALTESIQKAEITKTELAKGVLAYLPEETSVGFIFYPGGKVEYTAYEPLMLALAEKGITSILVEMPFNLAVLDVNAADGIIGNFPEIKNWYIGGHSLGGSMAASYVAKHAEDFDGLVLLASYSTANLSNSDLDVLSIYGSEDKVLNAEKYTQYKTNLPDTMTESVIEGGCHAYFGMYGAQNGDGTPTIENAVQIQYTAENIFDFITK